MEFSSPSTTPPEGPVTRGPQGQPPGFDGLRDQVISKTQVTGEFQIHRHHFSLRKYQGSLDQTQAEMAPYCPSDLILS